MPDILFFLLFGHFVGDFALQSDQMALMKGRSWKVLSLHALVYTLTTCVFWWLGKKLNGDHLFPQAVDAAVMLALYVQHWLQDLLKCRLSNGGKQLLFMDQTLHIGALFLIRILF